MKIRNTIPNIYGFRKEIFEYIQLNISNKKSEPPLGDSLDLLCRFGTR